MGNVPGADKLGHLLNPGQRVFEYEVIRQLGEGGFATVYEALDRMLDRRVAIKLLRVDKAGGDKTIKRFIQEARIAALLEHPNIATIHGLRIADQRIYMIMEYLSGGSLRGLLKEKGKLSLDHAVRLTTGICEGLAKLHERGIIHRDVKADNILLTADGRPKVTDFGIAHVPKSAGGLDLTRVGFQPTSLIFSSPEQLRGEKLDARSDVYQVGALLYFMLTGHHYIDIDMLESQASTQMAQHLRLELKVFMLLEKAICKDMPEGLQGLWRDAGALAGVVEQAMAKKKEDRFTDTLEMATALNALNISSIPNYASTEKLDLSDSREYNKRGLAHAGMRNYEQAIYNYSKAIQIDRHYAEAYNNRSAAHLLMDNYAQAVLDCNWAIELAPHFAAAYVNRGIANTGLRHYEEALQDYDRVIELNPKNIYAYYNRANTYVWMGKHEEAVEDYSQAIGLNPQFLAAYVNRGVVHDLMGDYQYAITDYNRAIELNPVYVHAFFNRARAYANFGNYEQAIMDYSRVIDMNPEHPYAYENRANCYLAAGDRQKAAEDQAKMMRQIPTIHPKQLNLARSMLMPATPVDFVTRD
ncbi:MAG: tetratricopeptide repeat protein [Anaerolineaceae bacterium]|nr:tetratricopeptide repeat protein [Anaerolineaceae bacterium]